MYTCMLASMSGQEIEKAQRVVNIEIATQADVQFADDWKSHLILDQVIFVGYRLEEIVKYFIIRKQHSPAQPLEDTQYLDWLPILVLMKIPMMKKMLSSKLWKVVRDSQHSPLSQLEKIVENTSNVLQFMKMMMEKFYLMSSLPQLIQ